RESGVLRHPSPRVEHAAVIAGVDAFAEFVRQPPLEAGLDRGDDHSGAVPRDPGPVDHHLAHRAPPWTTTMPTLSVGVRGRTRPSHPTVRHCHFRDLMASTRPIHRAPDTDEGKVR